MKNETLKGFCALLVTIVTLLVFSTNNASAFEVITGSVTEISGPDDLSLDPNKAIIAVDAFGNGDSSVNGVTFSTDRVGLGDSVVAEGKVQVGDVSVTITAPNQIDNWAGATAFTGGTEGSAAALSEIMRDIRWQGAPNALDVSVAGLTAGSTYKVQLLFNEGADRDRGWDIAVNGELAVDNFNSEGGDGTWTNANGFSYNVDATAAADGTIAVKMQNNIGGAAQVAADGNPILQAVIVSSTVEVLPIVDIDLTGADLGELATITNSGTLDGDFTAEVDTPSVTEVDGVKAVTLDGTNDWYVGPTSPLTGNADRTVETWVFNPDFPGEETIVAWGRRGGPDSTNWSMNYGNHNTWGALGGWGGSGDMAFVAGQTGAPEAGKWHHLALTYDKATNTRSIYVDGFLSNSENNDPAINTWGVANDPDATPLPIVIGNQNEPNGTRTDNLSGSLSIAKMKIWDQSLSASSVFNSFNSDRTTFGLGGPIVASFSSDSSSIIAGGSATLSWSILGADTISIDNGVGAVTGTETSVSPAETTTYTLTATDADGVEKTATTTINVSQPAPSSAVVIHQWKFEEEGGAGTTLVDSVGGKDGTLVDVGGNDGTVGGGSVTLAGGGKADSDYVRLPAGLISSLSSASIETWSTQRSAQNWSRVFSVGSSSSNVMHMSFTKGGNINENEWRWNAQSNLTLGNFGGQPTNPIDEQVHWVVTVDDTGGADNKTKVTIYKNGTEVAAGDTDNNLSGLNDADFFLGRSQWGDNAANASWDEFRIYNGALTADQVQNNTTAGPDGAPPAAAPTYAQNFDGFADGVTDLGDGSKITGAAARVLGGRLQLTRDGEGLGFSSFSVPAMEGTSEGFTATFDYELFDSAGGNDPADGFSFNYGNFEVGEQGQAEEGMAGRPGVTENLSFEVDTWRNGDPEQGVNISGLVNGADVGQLAFTNGVILEDNSRKTGSMEIRWDPSNGASFYSTGLTTNADFTDVDTGAFVGDDGFNFNFSARVGGANQDFFIDNLIIVAGKPTPAPLPAVIAYYDFEGQEGNTVADKGPNGLTADINRADQISIGGSGAPKGSTPGTGADFQGGFLNIPGISVEGIVNDVEGQNSYTLAAWIKPSDINGDKFLFGQTNQGIHNGIRNGGFLHQAHWGADTNGATRLSANEWVHAAFVYDGAADIGTIYLNGEADWTGGKRKPQGGGNLIVGGRNNGEANYKGIVDDVAVWNQVLTARQVAALAGGQSPINLLPLDEDNDGIPDGAEIALTGNTTDLGVSVGSKGVSLNSDRDNAAATMDADTVAGVIPSKGWVSTNGVDAGANGSITNGFTVDWSSNGTWNTNNGASNGDNKLMNGYTDAVGGDGAAQVKLTGINSAFADGYNLYVYFGSDGNDRTGKVALEGGKTFSYKTFSQQGGDFPAQYTQTTDEADGNPQANYAIFEGLSGDTQTVNIIRGSNNSGFHGVQIVGATTGDFDGDGLSDLAEFEGVTSPIDADSDDDGLNDGAEFAAGTNPNNTDSDNDGLSDGAEIAAGTDPTKVDSDNDGFNDGAEVAKGSDPASADSIPPFPSPIAYYDFEGKSTSSLDRSFNDNTASVSGNITFVDGGAPDGYTPGAAAQMSGGHFRVPGIDMNSQIRDSGTGSYTMTAWIKPDSLDGERFIFGQTSQGIHNGIRNNAFLHQAHWGADTNGNTNLNDLIPYRSGTSASNYPGGEAPAKAIDGNGGSKYLNFARTNTGIIVTPAAASVVKGIALSTANDAVERDPTSVAIYGTNDAITSEDNSLGEAENWTLIDSASVELPDARNTAGTVVNFDNDTEYTSYKIVFPTVKGAGNSMQIAEIQLFNSTNFNGVLPYEHMMRFHTLLAPDNAVVGIHAAPKIGDPDGWIHAAFVYDGATDTGSIYLNGELDWSGQKNPPNGGGHLIIGGRNNGERSYTGLIDEVAVWTEALAAPEVAALATGGNPIISLPDEDGDGFLDAWETKYAGNLTTLGGTKDASLLAYLNFDNQADDQSGNSLNGTLNGPAAFSADAEGFSGAAGDYSINLGAINDKSAVVIDNATLDSALSNNTMAVSFWQNNTQVGNTSSFWIHSPSAGANERGFQAHVPWGNGTIFFDQSGCCNGNQRLTAAGQIKVNEWQHFVFQRNADGIQQIWVDGQKVAENGGTAEALEAFTKITIGAEGGNLNNSLAGRLDDFAVWNRMLTDAEITTLSGGAATTEILNLTAADTDGDGLTDAEEYATQASDPTKADSDNDGLSDAAEIALGTQPLNADSDGDGLLDGEEGVASATYTQNFNGFDDGVTELGDGSVIFGQAASVQAEALRLTIDGQGLGFSSFSVPGLKGSSKGFTATFDYELFDSEAANDPADGFSINYGNAPLGDQGQAEEGMAGRPGVTENISFEVDTWRNGDAEQGVNISGLAGGADVGQLAFTNGIILEDNSTKTGSMTLSWNPSSGASFTTTGLTTNADFSDVGTGDFVASDDHTFNISARVGGANQTLIIDNLVITAAESGLGLDPLDADFDDDGYNDGEEIKTGSDPKDANSIPPSLVGYYNFERSSGNIVPDLSAWGNNATVVRPDQTTIVSGGTGPSPAKSADFQGGYLNIPGVSMSKVISGDGSYTLAAWIKPSDLGGNKFLFGQSSQGIHNGIRNGGFLHQAHWGADTNGATNLNDYDASANDGWVHAVWVYDGPNDTGKMYLDGVEDYSGDKRAPNGSGNLIVGGSNGGGDNFKGLVDEVAVWNIAAPADYVAKLAAGQSPLDDDGDGLPDTWAAGFGVTDADGDDDGDNITNANEFLVGTNPTSADSDGDGTNDDVEIAGGFDPADALSLPLPAPIAYYTFEGNSSSVVTDRTFNGNDATVGRPNQTTLGVEGGAPAGASPGKAANLQDGLLTTPIDATPIIEGDGSYTFTAWIKPSDLGGDKFLFGQTSQGIHNGIRNNGFLHQAHWGADTNGATNLNGYLADDEDGWVHAAWVYDAAADKGQIYLDGKLDYEGGKRPPQGSGTIIIGGRNGGGAGYRGLVDEIAIWDVALKPGNIANIAAGQVPAASDDSDGDGLADGWENLFAGNLTDLGGEVAGDTYGTSVNNALTAANSGISADNTYTHAISGGGAETVNGVDFEVLDANTTPTNFAWDVSSVKNQLNDNNGGWDVGASGVTDDGLKGLLGSFTFNNDGAVGSNQTFTLSGLNAGQDYKLTLFARKWANDTQRQQTLEFTTGGASGSLTFSEDHPELAPISAATRDTAYSISQVYRAGDDGTVSLKFTVADDDTQGAPGSFHMYGLSNQETTIASGDFDGDGLSDAAEFASLASDPTKADSDDDGLTDGEEVAAGTSALSADTDGDGLNDAAEIAASTNPLDSDSDDDGYADGSEIRAGSDPTDSNSVPSSLVAYFDFESDAAPDTIVYDIPAGTEGGQEYGGSLGMDFDTSGELTVSALGAFDSGSDGLSRSINVQLWSRADGAGVEVLASADFTTEDPGTLEGGQRFKALADAVTLPAGSYTIVGTGYGAGEPNINLGVAPAEGLSTNDAGGVITFVGGSRWGDAGAFPANVDGGPAQRYGAGTFKVAAPVSNTVADKGTWGNNGTVTRPDQTKLGIEGGAPNGASPGTAASFENGMINVPGVDLSGVVSRDGSYTFAAWIKPTDLGGDKFIFGQTNQGIHNGIRNNGFLHQAHWGADTNGATNLNDYDASANDGWVHAAFVYDGPADLGQIYLDGKLDWEGGKRAPNGGGNLIIGGRNNGEAGFVGLIDEVAIWDVAKSADDIAFVAGGGSPLIDAGADADGDGLNTVEEIAAGTDPNNADTDGDGVSDGDEIAAGSSPTDANSRPGYYAQNFDAFDNGTKDLGDGTVIAGEAASVQDGRLQLTIDGQGLGFSSFSVPGLAGTTKGFTATFDYEMFDSEGANDPADGFSFNYGSAELGELGAAEEGMSGKADQNLSFEVDTWRNGDPEQGVNISGVLDGEDVGELAFTNGVVLEDNSRKTGSMEISWDPSKGATFITTGLTTNAEFTAVDTGAFIGDDGYTFNFSARVGGANQDLFIDNLVIIAGKPAQAPLPAPVVYFDFEDQEGNTVADKGANGLDGEINRADQLTIGGSGAPKGSTPGTGADFQGGFLNVAGASVDGIVNDVEGQNSYTMTAWIKPSDLAGDKFLFGQTTQGIHNGIRGGGFLHQAHWGADNNASTNLSTLEGEWVHAAWVYDGVADKGTIYLNGEVDAEVDKRPPNGSGNLIVGGRNGGGQNYLGLVDDVAVWNEVLTARQIKAIAGGQSPINAAPADDDEDGIPDGYELALVGNITELGGPVVASKSLGVSFNSDRDNAVAAMDADTVAGVVPSTGWVSTDGGADAAGGANGSITNGITVDWSSNGTWNTNNGGDNGDNKLMNGYVDAIGGDGAAQVAISGINAEFADGYDLYVYFGSDGNNRTGKVSLVDGATYSFNTASAQGGDFPAQYARTTDEGDGNPAANYALYEGLSGDAQTVDLIRGSSNSGFHGIQIVSSGSGDYDGDGLSDLAEYEGVTSPIVADGDEDGLNDGAEIAAGTNPNNADTDSDGVADGAEIAAGTDPTDEDSDDDGYSDGNEIAKGSDPTDANSIPGLPTPIAYYNFEAKSSTALDRSFNDNTATASGNITFVDEGAPAGSSPGAAAQLDGGHFRIPGIDINSQIRDSGDGSYTMVAWIKPSATDGERFVFGQTNQGIHHGIRNGGFLHSAHWGADWNASTNLNDVLPNDDDGWVHAAWVYDGAKDEAKIYLDGVLDGTNGQRAQNGGGHLIIGGRNNGEAQYRGLIDDVAIWTETLAAAEIADLAAGGSPISSLTDSDGDGFVDVWENKYAGNLTDLGAGVYSQTFTGPDGSKDLGDGSVIFGEAASLLNNQLRLTIDGQGLGFSSFSVPGIAGSSEGWTAEFDYLLFDSAGANNPADGFSFNYGDAPLGDQGQAEEGMAGRPGVTENVSFEVDTWQNFDAEQGVNISGVVGGADAGQFAFNNGPILEDDSTKTGKINVAWSPTEGATFISTGFTTNADFAEVETGDFVANDEHTFNISARVGGANQTLIIDNLVIRAGSADFDNDGLSDLAEYNSGASDPTKTDSDGDGLSDGEEVAAGTQPLVADTDGDGIADGAEGTAGTDPLDSDTDDDGYSDGVEVKVGSDPTKSSSTPPSLLAYYDFEAASSASITSIEEEGIGGDEPAVISNDFNEDSLTFSDRTHQHNGAAFNAEGNLDVAGETVVGLPDYLIGGDYIRFANNARDNNPYTATVTADKATSWYLLVDNRLDGDAGNKNSPNSTDPVIGGTLQWITDDGWQRVNTGISPNGQADYTGVDEGGDSEGAGQGLNQFYAVYTLTSEEVSVLIGGQGIGGSNMLSLVAKTQTSTTVVTDKGAWGNNATVERPDQTVVGIEGGAPNGASPGTAADFQGGFLNVPGVDMSRVISGEGSYTLAAWIKPSDLGGNKFLFGQSSQGIHNGIRNGGFLHQAHWGADTNGATNLTDYDASANDGWVHAAWVYDGAADTGKIYLDGVEDYSGDKRAPNGSGNLIVGGSNGGGDNFKGLVDEIAVWDIAASADVIAALAAGTSPLDISSSAPSAFEVTTFTYDKDTGALDITWSTNPGDTYGLQYSTDLETWVDWQWAAGTPNEGQVIAIEAEEDEMSFSLQGATNPFGPQGANLPSVFVRAVKK